MCLMTDVSDASAPRPSLHSVESQASLDVSSADVSPSDGVFDDEGLLFGDSESSVHDMIIYVVVIIICYS